MARIMAFDFGTKRIGIAATDPLKIIASPMNTLHPDEFFPFLEKYLQAEQVEAFVVGEPRYMDGSLMPVNRELDRFISKLNTMFPQVPVHKIDERFTSKMAGQTLVQAGLSKKDRQDKKKLDSVSAALILQTYLASHL